MKKLLIIIVLMTCVSCNKDKFVEVKYPNGNIKSRIHINDKNFTDGLYEEFYETGEIKIRTTYTDGKLLDTVFTYHKNGMLKSKGKQKNSLPFGWSNYYDSNGNLTIQKEILIVDEKMYLNQVKYFDKNGKIDPKKSSYFDLLIKDTLILGGNIGEIIFHHDTLGCQQKYTRIIVDQYSEGLIKKDTFVGEKDKNWFGIYNDRVGNKKVSGKVEEQLMFVNKNKSLPEGKYIIRTITKYFEKDVFVKAE